MSRAISIAGVRPLGWLARVRAKRTCWARACSAQLLGAGAAGLAPRARGMALGMEALDDRTRQRSGPASGSIGFFLTSLLPVVLRAQEL